MKTNMISQNPTKKIFRSLIFWRAVVCESVASFLYVLLVCLAEAMLANDPTLPASSR